MGVGSPLPKPSPARNILWVGTGGQFATVTAALATITPAANNRYTIMVIGGITDNVVLTNYIDLVGLGYYASRITSGTIGQPVIRSPGGNATSIDVHIHGLGLIAGVNATDYQPTLDLGWESNNHIVVSDCLITGQYNLVNTNDDGRGVRVSGSGSFIEVYNCLIENVDFGIWNTAFTSVFNEGIVILAKNCRFNNIGGNQLFQGGSGKIFLDNCTFGKENMAGHTGTNSYSIACVGSGGVAGDVFAHRCTKFSDNDTQLSGLRILVGSVNNTARYWSFGNYDFAEITVARSTQNAAYVLDEWEGMSVLGNPIPSLPAPIYSDLARGTGTEPDSGTYRRADKDDASTMPAEALWVYTRNDGGISLSSGSFIRKGLMYLGIPDNIASEGGALYVGTNGTLTATKPRLGIVQQVGLPRKGAIAIVQVEVDQSINLDNQRYVYDGASPPGQGGAVLINTTRDGSLTDPGGAGNEDNPKIVLATGSNLRLPRCAYKAAGTTTDFRGFAQTSNGETFAFLGNTIANGHRWYFAHGKPYPGLQFDLTVNGDYGGAGNVVWEYWNGSAWTTLTELTAYAFAADGNPRWNEPANWTAKVLVVGDEAEWAAAVPAAVSNVLAFWVRVGVTAVTTAATVDLIRALGKYVVAKSGDVTEVLADAAAITAGDTLVTSGATVGRVMSNNAQTDPKKIIGIALEAKGAGAGSVLAEIK